MDIAKIKGLVEKHIDLILKTERDLWKIPEAGYKEFKTDAYMKAAFRKLGYDLTEAEGITGFYTVVDTGKKGPTVLVLAELDALYCADHPECDKETKAVHACGHNAQMAAILGSLCLPFYIYTARAAVLTKASITSLSSLLLP